MYNGKFDCRVTARCPFCQKVTQKEMDYRYENFIIGGERRYEILDSFNCSFCRKVAFKESRVNLLAFLAEEVGEKEIG